MFSEDGRCIGIEHERGTFDARRDLLQQIEPLSPMAASTFMNPVMLPPGRDRLTMKPEGRDNRKHDGGWSWSLGQCCRDRRGRAEDDIGPRPDQLRRETTRSAIVSLHEELAAIPNTIVPTPIAQHK